MFPCGKLCSLSFAIKSSTTWACTHHYLGANAQRKAIVAPQLSHLLQAFYGELQWPLHGKYVHYCNIRFYFQSKGYGETATLNCFIDGTCKGKDSVSGTWSETKQIFQATLGVMIAGRLCDLNYVIDCRRSVIGTFLLLTLRQKWTCR